MTYFELVSLLDEMEHNERNNDYINTLNNVNVSLEGDRYLRFINQVNYLLTRRLKDYMDKIILKACDNALSLEELKIELDLLKQEVDYNKQIAMSNLIEKDNQDEFIKSVNKNSNEIYRSIYDLYDEEDYKLMIEEYIMEE